MDRLSHQPKYILHDILSKLPRKDAARTCILSKAWSDTWHTFPILCFNEDNYVRRWTCIKLDQEDTQQMEDFTKERSSFFNSVEEALLRFKHKGLSIKEFKLTITNPNPVTPHIDNWIKLAVESGVEVLDLTLARYHCAVHEGYYYLPSCILEAKSLIKLKLHRSFRIDRAFLNRTIMFSSLQSLSLGEVYLGDEQVIQNLILSCPSIEYLTLHLCSVAQSEIIDNHGIPKPGLKSLTISGLPKLVEVKLIAIQEVDIDAPSLKSCYYCPFHIHRPCKINMDRCKNLRELRLIFLKTIVITDQWLLELFPKFPLLEKLELYKCTMSEMIKLSCDHLKVLEFYECLNLVEVNIDAPNLHRCAYYGAADSMAIITFLNSSIKLEVNVQLQIKFYHDFLKLKEFLRSFKPISALVSLALHTHNLTDELNANLLQEIAVPPPSIRHLKICTLPERETLFFPVVTGLPFSCQPASISIMWDYLLSTKTFIKLLCETLVRRLDKDCCRRENHAECPWHGLKKAEVTCSSSTIEYVDVEAFLVALPTLPPQEDISFNLKY